MNNPIASCDICILGAGPAGLAAAIACASSIRANIVVIEQQAQGQLRVGENVPPETILLLKKLGLAPQFYGAGHEPCPGFASVWGKEAVGYNDFIVNPMGHSWRLNRQAFDQTMVQKAQELGVNIHWQTRFTRAEKAQNNNGFILALNHKARHKTEHRTNQNSLLNAGFVIDATGSNALFAKSQGATKMVHDKLVATVRFATVNNVAKGKQVRIEATPEGWCYHTLLPQQKVVSMIVSEPGISGRLKQNNYQTFETTLANTHFIGEHLKKLQLNNHQYHAYPVSSAMLSKMEGDNWIAIGDAAASFDPIAAQGIFKALQHGLMAAEIAQQQFTNQPPTLHFEHKVKTQYQHYVQARNHMYGLEQRWQNRTFWQNRQVNIAANLEAG